MNVLYAMVYAPEKGGSGAPIYTYHLLREMVQRGHKVGVIFSIHRSYKNPDRTFYQSIPLYFEKPAIFDNQPKVVNSIAFKDMSPEQAEKNIQRFYKGLKEAVLKNRYELIHVQHGMYIGYATSLIKKELGTPYVITLHTMELNFLSEFPDPILAMVAVTKADKIIALTQAQKQRFLYIYNKENIIQLAMKQSGKTRQEIENLYSKFTEDKEINPENISVCPLGIDTELFDVKKDFSIPLDIQTLKIPTDASIVMYAGRLIEMKGISSLLRAELIYNRSKNIHTIILGGGKLEKFIRGICRRRSHVHYLGFKEQQDMPLYYNFTGSRNGVFCVPSSSEGMSLVNLEAMACGIRVVACCKEDMGNLDFMQSPNAVFAEFGNESDIADKITKMLHTMAPSRKEIRAKVEKYNPTNMFNYVYNIYSNIKSTL